MLDMVTFTINIPPMLVYIPYMDPMGTESGFVGVQSLFCHPLQKNSNLAVCYGKSPCFRMVNHQTSAGPSNCHSYVK